MRKNPLPLYRFMFEGFLGAFEIINHGQQKVDQVLIGGLMSSIFSLAVRRR